MDQDRLERWYAGIEAGDQALVEDTKRAAKEGSAEDDYAAVYSCQASPCR